MKWIVKFRWPIVAAWLVVMAVLLFTAPNMADLVREKGEIKLPDGYPSSLATEMEKKHNPDKQGQAYIAVYTSDKKLTKTDLSNIEDSLSSIEKNKKSLHITSVVDSFNQPELKDKFLSKDGKTMVATLNVVAGETPVKEIRNDIDKKMDIKGVDTYLTGNALIQEDVVQSSEDGVHKTEGITIVFILVVLVLVFRSAVAPFIPLLTVGISYLTSQAVVSFLVDKWDFPVSTYTQIFMVCILFGIGTDYCILLMSRFKEEVGSGLSGKEAVFATYRTAGKTVIYSGIAVLVAFASLSFVQFELYRSAVAVAVGIVVLLVALFTIVPFFMATLGTKLFWPLNKNVSHKENKLWGAAGKFTFARPFLALLIVAAITVPPIILYTGNLSFNSLDEISDKYPSKKGFDVVSDSFGAGQVAPTTVYLENDDPMKTSEYLALLEEVSTDLSHVKGVDMVLSATRPTGKRLDDIYVKDQSKKVGDGLDEAGNGIGTIQKGLSEASTEMAKSEPQLNEAVKSVGELQSGTTATKEGVDQLQAALTQISTGIKAGASGAGDLEQGVKTAREQLTTLQNGQQQIQSGYEQVGAALQKVADQTAQFQNPAKPAIDTSALNTMISDMGNAINTYKSNHPVDPQFTAIIRNFEKLKQATGALQPQIEAQIEQEMAKAKQQMTALNQGIQTLASTMSQLNEKNAQITQGLTAFNSGLGQIDTGLTQLETGLNQAANGQDQVVTKMPEISSALAQLAAGQGQLQSGFSAMTGQIGELTNGLKQSADGLGQIQSGITGANDFVKNWSTVPYDESGIYVPDQLVNNADYQKVLDQYMSSDGKLATLNLVLTKNPYSDEAMDAIDGINDQLKSSLQGTKLENANIGIGGMTSINYDTRDMSSADYHLVLMFVLTGVFIVLVIVLRSLVMPLYLIASLVLTYFASIGIAEIIFARFLGYDGLTWATPFFGFVVLVALGIDYSIFLMTRFNEYHGMPIRERMILTMKNMGGVIFSAVLILGGTFAAMMPAGVLSLLEIATVVLIGLLLYAFVVLPLFVPVMVRLFGQANWWPFITRKNDHQENVKPKHPQK
ncbi:MMPL family transporter [Listeria booriae]|uniref:MMPL family transporter n=1 Tax=Listeria booriae TaxID=1552123 RepID=UPI001626CFDF|nr:MMPL family transporter [Listeria booriae]MBC2675884.1 MMPL family transporter [Listeria booriae]